MTLVKLIDNLRIVDPAVGSGAFPMGILNKLVFILGKLDPDNKLWKVAQTDAVKKNVSDPALKRKLIGQICEQFKNKNFDYGRKLYLIQKCIYGVDIQQIAVEIAKLRFFIALLVDEQIDKEKDNWGIEPLPNLDFKIMQGNSLISEFMGINLDNGEAQDTETFAFKDDIDDIIDEFQQKKNEYQNEPDAGNKSQLRQQIDDLLIRLFETKLKKQKKTYFTKLKAIDSKYSTIPNQQQRDELIKKEKQTLSQKEGFDLNKFEEQLRELSGKNKTKPFFAWKLYFAEVFQGNNPGFDIVIANPPYKILTRNNTNNNELKYLLGRYGTIKDANSKNLFVPFVEYGVELTRRKGVLTYIVPEGLFQTRSYRRCSELLKNEGSVWNITTFQDFVFENAVTGNLVFLFTKTISTDTVLFRFDKDYNLLEVSQTVNPVVERVLSNDTYPLSEVSTLFKGMVVKDREHVVKPIKKSRQHIFLLGKSISKWRIKKQYFTNYSHLTIIGGTKKIEKHNQYPRILIRRTGSNLCCCFLKYPALTESTLYSCWSKLPDVSNRYLLSLLNSRLLDYFIKQKMITNKQAFPQILMTDLGELPIKKIDDSEQLPFESLVNNILSAIEKDNYLENHALQSKVQDYEHQIDQLVYKLYDLTPDEIAIVEGDK